MKVVYKFTISIALFIGLWSVLELICYLTYTPSFFSQMKASLQRDSELFWLQRPNYSGMIKSNRIITNSLGFRTTSVNASRKVILNLGASPTFGLGVEGEQTYSAFLQRLLPSYKVYNGGQIGYSSYQGKLLLKRLMPLVKPSIVTIAYYINDIDSTRFFFQSDLPDSKIVNTLGSASSLLNLLEKSYVFRTVVQLMQRKAKFNHSSKHLRVSEIDYIQNIKEIIVLLQRSGAEIILVGIPNLSPIGSRAYKISQRYLDHLKNISVETKLNYIDLRGVMGRNKSLFATPLHPSPEGHQLIANELQRILKGTEAL